MSRRPFISPYGGQRPSIHRCAYVDISARVIGRVVIGEGASVWPMAVIRADSDEVRIGRRAAVLDLSLVEAPAGRPVVIGEESLVSHSAVVHGAVLGERVLVGIGATILDGARIGQGSIVGARSLITAETQIGPNSLVLGSPAKVVRETTLQEREMVRLQIEELFEKSRRYMAPR